MHPEGHLCIDPVLLQFVVLNGNLHVLYIHRFNLLYGLGLCFN